MRYWPNPTHKAETTEAGPPRWRPDSSKCPRMDPAERNRLLEGAISEDPGRVDSVRYAFRAGAAGQEWFAARFTRMIDGEPEFHGYPCSYVPGKVLKQFWAEGRISEAEYRRLRRELG